MVVAVHGNPPSAAAGAGRAGGRGVLGLAVAFAFGFRRRAQRACGGPASEWLGAAQGDLLERRYGDDLHGVRLAGQDAVGLVADGRALAADERVAVVVLYLFPRALVDDGLVALPARPLLALARRHGHAAELKAAKGLPWPLVILVKRDGVEAGALERRQKCGFLEGARDAAAPQFGVLLHFFRHRLVGDHVADRHSAAALEHPEHLAEELLAVGLAHQIEHTVGDDHVYRLVRDHRRGPAQAPLKLLEAPQLLG